MASISATAGRSSGEHGRKNTVSRRAWWKKPPVRSSSGIAGSRELEAARTRRARRAAETRVAEERGPRAGAASGQIAGGMQRGRVCGPRPDPPLETPKKRKTRPKRFS